MSVLKNLLIANLIAIVILLDIILIVVIFDKDSPIRKLIINMMEEIKEAVKCAINSMRKKQKKL